MSKFQAISSGGPAELHQPLVFDATSVSEALAFLAERRPRGTVELWREGSFLGNLQHVLEDGASFWRLG